MADVLYFCLCARYNGGISKLYALRTTITSHNVLLFIQWTQETMKAPIGTPELKKGNTKDMNWTAPTDRQLFQNWLESEFECIIFCVCVCVSVYVCVLFSYANDLCWGLCRFFLLFIAAVTEAVAVITILLLLPMPSLSSFASDNHSSFNQLNHAQNTNPD